MSKGSSTIFWLLKWTRLRKSKSWSSSNNSSSTGMWTTLSREIKDRTTRDKDISTSMIDNRISLTSSTTQIKDSRILKWTTVTNLWAKSTSKTNQTARYSTSRIKRTWITTINKSKVTKTKEETTWLTATEAATSTRAINTNKTKRRSW